MSTKDAAVESGTVTTWALALCLCVIVGLSYKLDPALDFDGAAERAQAEAMDEAQRAERLLQAAQAVCSEVRGPQAEARWTEDGKLVCFGRRGKPVQVAGGV